METILMNTESIYYTCRNINLLIKAANLIHLLGLGIMSLTYTKKTNPKIIILEILVYKMQPEIMNNELYFVYQNFQNCYFWISLFSIFFEVICWKWSLTYLMDHILYQIFQSILVRH